jgi:hypothetical protein
MPSEHFYHALLQLNAWCWHLRDHLDSISKILEETDFDSTGGATPRE